MTIVRVPYKGDKYAKVPVGTYFLSKLGPDVAVVVDERRFIWQEDEGKGEDYYCDFDENSYAIRFFVAFDGFPVEDKIDVPETWTWALCEWADGDRGMNLVQRKSFHSEAYYKVSTAGSHFAIKGAFKIISLHPDIPVN